MDSSGWIKVKIRFNQTRENYADMISKLFCRLISTMREEKYLYEILLSYVRNMMIRVNSRMQLYSVWCPKSQRGYYRFRSVT